MKTLRLYLELAKIRIVFLVLWTVGIGYRMGGGTFVEGLLTVLGVGLAAAGAAMLNHWMDRDVDARMPRTRNRPIPSGRVRPRTVFLLGTFHVLLGLALLTRISWTVVGLTTLTVLLYTPVYTWHKRRSPYSAVVGSLIGALPPAIGAVAARGTWGLEATLLFALLFLWQPAHFWALARMKTQDYGQAEIPVLPRTHGAFWTDLLTLLYAASLLPVVALFSLTGRAPLWGILWAWGLTLGFVGVCVGVLFKRTRPHLVFRYSTLYLLGVLLPFSF